MKISTKDAFNIPNILCYIRILLIPFFSYYLLIATPENAKYSYIAAFLIFLSGLTDMLDGLIARRFNMITEWGKALDPIADKLTQFSIAVCLSIKIRWLIILVLIVFVKELFMGICCLVFLRKNKKLDGAMWFGKVATAVFYVVIFVLLVFPTLAMEYKYILIAIATAFMLLSLTLYIREFYRMSKLKESSANLN